MKYFSTLTLVLIITLISSACGAQATPPLTVNAVALQSTAAAVALTMIAETYGGGPVGVETLAAGLAEPRDTIEDVVEPFLIQLGLVARTARGRCLNGRAWAHLGLPQPKAAQDGLFD